MVLSSTHVVGSFTFQVYPEPNRPPSLDASPYQRLMEEMQRRRPKTYDGSPGRGILPEGSFLGIPIGLNCAF